MAPTMKKIIFTISIIIVVVFIFPMSLFAQVTFRNPLNTGTVINSYFDNNLSITGTQKYDCSTSTTRSDHQGVDFPVSLGTSVYSAGAGRIYDTWNSCPDTSGANGSDPKCGGPTNPGNSYGNYYRIDHAGDTNDGSGLVSIYAHMKQGTVTLSVGTPVSCSQQLGQSASSGGSSGPHLHFELRTDGINALTKIDPFIGNCSHLTPPSWTAVSNGQPTTQCDPLPLAPSNVVVSSPTASSLIVNFRDNALNETNILVERKIGISGSWISLGGFGALTSANSWSWMNSSLASNQTYCYRLRAQNSYGYSPYSNESCGTTSSISSTPPAPSNVTITNPTTSSLRVNFTDNATNETNILIERKIGASGSWISLGGFGALAGASSWYWINGGLFSRTMYCYRLKAINASGSSSYSNEACGTTL